MPEDAGAGAGQGEYGGNSIRMDYVWPEVVDDARKRPARADERDNRTHESDDARWAVQADGRYAENLANRRCFGARSRNGDVERAARCELGDKFVETRLRAATAGGDIDKEDARSLRTAGFWRRVRCQTGFGG